MATTLTIVTGPFTSTLTATDEAAAQEVLLRFAHATGASPAATPQAKLDHVAAQLAQYMLTIARERYIQEESAAIAQEAVTSVHW